MTNNNNKKSKIVWFHTHRLRILIVAAATVIPLTLILLAYVGTYFTYNKVVFDDESTDFVRSFESMDDLDQINLDFVWSTLKYPSFDEDGEIDSTGYYQFKFSYNAKSTYSVDSVSVTPVLQTNWIDYRSLGSMVTLTEDNSTNMLITYNYELPERRLIFINVESPMLYLKVDVVYTSASAPLENTQYIKINLDDYNPNTVLES
jgi:hypothetical protein